MKALTVSSDTSVGIDSATERINAASLLRSSQEAQAAAATAQQIVDTAAQSSTLATVATSGSYTDLINKPTIPAAQIQSDWNQDNAGLSDFIKNKPTKVSDFTPSSGITGSRPASPAVGTMYFDTSLGKPIWFKSPGWVDATGTGV